MFKFKQRPTENCNTPRILKPSQNFRLKITLYKIIVLIIEKRTTTITEVIKDFLPNFSGAFLKNTLKSSPSVYGIVIDKLSKSGETYAT